MTRNFTIDTNFFIAGFGENPNEYEKLNAIFRKLKISILIPDYVKREMRWYMRRVIEPKLIVKEINPSKLKKFEVSTQKRVDIKLPQTPDMAVAFLANNEKIAVVSSDMRLVEVSQKIGLQAMMNSAFLIMLLGEEINNEDKNYLKRLYEKLFADEITYSVQSQSRYDPVVRIQKIMDSAINVVRGQIEFDISTNNKSEFKEKKSTSIDIPEYRELEIATRETRIDISKYIKVLEQGNYKKLEAELKKASSLLTDLATEVRMAGIEEEDPVYKEAMTTVAHLLLLASSVALGEQKLGRVEAIVDLLNLLLLENDEVEKRLDMEVHLLRITLFFLTGQLSRLKFYFSSFFTELCMRRERQDILTLHRTMGLIMMILTTRQVEKKALVKDFSEIQYIIQLGMQFVAVNKINDAWLIFEQAVYLSLNSNMTGLLLSTFEVMLPLSFKKGIKFKPSFQQILSVAEKKEKKLSFVDYRNRLKINNNVNPELLRKRPVDYKKLPAEFTGFLDVISSSIIDFKRIGRSSFVRAIDWQTMHIVGIVDPTLSLETSLTVGSSIQILQGKFRIILPTKSLKESRNINLLIIGRSDKTKFLIRRAGQLMVAQSRVIDFDL